MAPSVVEQILSDGTLVVDVDTRLSDQEKTAFLLDALPGAVAEKYAGVRVVRFGDQVILKKQVTHLGHPWPGYKKRIQIPKSWLDVERKARADGLTPRFVGIYHYGDVTVFVDFDPSTYVQRKANNSAAHVATNDLYQAQLHGLFSRFDRNDNELTSVRADQFSEYLRGTLVEEHPRLELFARFNEEFLIGRRIEALEAIQEMHAEKWPDRFQGEWAGFYLEFRLDKFLREHGYDHLIKFQKVKTKGAFDFDLVFQNDQVIEYYGDLKASNMTKDESPGNDAADIERCVREYGSFWYVIYEHETWHGKDEADLPTIAWNEWRRSVGHVMRGAYNERSYASRFKSAVTFKKMVILEINEVNFHIVLDTFNQGVQVGGAVREPKVKIKKKDIDNFLIFSSFVD